MDHRIGPGALAGLVGERPEGGSAYVWLADRIGQLVSDGRVAHDTRLPGERDAAAALSCSRTTVAHAYGLLRDRGFAVAKQGSGTRICVPGGPVHGGGEPLAGAGGLHGGRVVAADEIDLINAAPSAPEGLGEHYRRSIETLGSYTHSGGYHQGGIPLLREAIAHRYTARGVPTDPDQILVTTGALAGIAATAHALLRRGDRVVSDATGYPNSLATLRGLGVRLTPAVENSFGVDLPALDDVFTRATPRAMFTMTDFHNPTGRLMSDEDRGMLADAWRRHDVVGVVDETLADLWWDAEPQVQPMAAHAPECISIGSASKTYWGGLRLGWVRAPQTMLSAVAAARLRFDLGAPVLEQIVLARLLDTQPGLDEQRRLELASRRVLLRDRINQLCPNWTCELPEGGLSLWWKLPAPRSREVVAAASRRGLILSPGSAFSLDGRGLESRLRTPFTASEGELEQAAQILGDVAAEAGC